MTRVQSIRATGFMVAMGTPSMLCCVKMGRHALMTSDAYDMISQHRDALRAELAAERLRGRRIAQKILGT